MCGKSNPASPPWPADVDAGDGGVPGDGRQRRQGRSPAAVGPAGRRQDELCRQEEARSYKVRQSDNVFFVFEVHKHSSTKFFVQFFSTPRISSKSVTPDVVGDIADFIDIDSLT